ncbi:M42 family peptidase [Companilactobacillus suantsaicola]|uniref:M42 family peptidase n=1 Tax=Companilactobacillus suantsaicola TaxID=2487723 RepID=A0A4Z0JSF8_9LACO|nr:M42 family peptidase [Companilactobacillus suantsaicola]TGD25452.1 M42 family peptidase [Companilactobacillus suantsaicola]
MVDKTLLNEVINAPGVSGNEKAISQVLRNEFKKYSDEIIYDNLGSIYAVKKSKQKNAPHVLISGHMDEVGFIIKKFNENGTVKALSLGEINKNCLLGTAVLLPARDLHGTILGFDVEGNALDSKGDVLIDFGFSNLNELEESDIKLGDRVSFLPVLNKNENSSKIFASNWNGRYAPLMEIEFLKEIQNESFDFDLFVGCTVQEQVGLRGVQTATNLVKPDLGIVLDTDQAFDYQEKVDDRIGCLGKGLLVNFYDKTVLPNRLLISELKKLCRNKRIPFQFYYSMEGSDAAWINKLRTGCPTLFINVPIRNMNTPNSVLDLNDFSSAKEALLDFVGELNTDKIQSFKEENR